MIDAAPEPRWTLSAPESQALLWGPETGDAWALKPAILELVVRQALRLASVEHRRFFIFPTQTTILARGPRSAPPSPALQAVIDAYPTSPRTYAGGTVGVPVDQLARAVFTRNLRQARVRGGIFSGWQMSWDWSSGGYVQSVVLPCLESRGLFAREARLRLGPIEAGGARWTLTPHGLAALEYLRQVMATGRHSFARWVEHDPARAMQYVETAGTALLLLGGLAPWLRHLHRRASADGGPSEALADGAGSGSATEYQGPAVAALGLDALVGSFGLGAIGDLDAAFHAIGVGVDRARDVLRSSDSGGGE